MNFNPKVHHRRSIRLKGYDYSRAGAYYITIVTQGRESLFGKVVQGEMQLNRFGQIVEHAWFDLPHHYPHAELDAFCIMPNHVHGIVVLTDPGEIRRGGSISDIDTAPSLVTASGSEIARDAKTRPYQPPKIHGLSEIVRAFKSFSARRINSLRGTHGNAVWQRDYYEHVIRDENDLRAKCAYISRNPMRWEEDKENIQ